MSNTTSSTANRVLSNVLLTLNLLAFFFHSICDQVCKLWIEAREKCGRRIRFFLTLDTITAWQYFNSWHFLLTQVVSHTCEKLKAPKPDNRCLPISHKWHHSKGIGDLM